LLPVGFIVSFFYTSSSVWCHSPYWGSWHVFVS